MKVADLKKALKTATQIYWWAEDGIEVCVAYSFALMDPTGFSGDIRKALIEVMGDIPDAAMPLIKNVDGVRKIPKSEMGMNWDTAKKFFENTNVELTDTKLSYEFDKIGQVRLLKGDKQYKAIDTKLFALIKDIGEYRCGAPLETSPVVCVDGDLSICVLPVRLGKSEDLFMYLK